MSCYTLLSGFRLPWPPSCCLNASTPFVGSDARALRHLNRALGASLIASSAYQKWPTWGGLAFGPTVHHTRSTTDQSQCTFLPTTDLLNSKPHARWHRDLSPNGKLQLGSRCNPLAFEESTENSNSIMLLMQTHNKDVIFVIT